MKILKAAQIVAILSILSSRALADAWEYGYQSYMREDLPTAIKFLEKAIEQESPQAMFLRAIMHQHGRGGPVDLKKAAALYSQAAKMGLARAQLNLGVLYFNGQGRKKNIKLAKQWYEKAAEQGLDEAQANLGHIYQDGEGPNYGEAARWYQLAAEQGHATAQIELGYLYADGKGVAKDLGQALFWWRTASSSQQLNPSQKEELTRDLARLEKEIGKADREKAEKRLSEWKPKQNTTSTAQMHPMPKLNSASEFRIIQGVMICSLGKEVAAKIEKGKFPEVDCLRVGKFVIGENFAPIEAKLGKPVKTVTQDGIFNHVYLLPPAAPDLAPYIVFGVKNGKLAAIQITSGQTSDSEMGFSSICLGDPEEKILETVGHYTKKSPSPIKGAELWAYDPFNFSFEVKDGKVFSIRVFAGNPS
jgi:TPR repeat protein